MSRSLTITRQLVTTLVLAGAFAALTTGQALAASRSGSGADTDGWYRYATSPDRLTGPAPVSDVASSLRLARLDGSAGATPFSTAVVAATGQSSFDWTAAGIGAAAAVGFVLLLTLAGGLITARRRGRLAI